MSRFGIGVTRDLASPDHRYIDRERDRLGAVLFVPLFFFELDGSWPLAALLSGSVNCSRRGFLPYSAQSSISFCLIASDCSQAPRSISRLFPLSPLVTDLAAPQHDRKTVESPCVRLPVAKQLPGVADGGVGHGSRDSRLLLRDPRS
jgi:hypothetical protein